MVTAAEERRIIAERGGRCESCGATSRLDLHGYPPEVLCEGCARARDIWPPITL